MRCLLALLPALALAQAPPPEVRASSRPYVPLILRAESNLVQVGVVVRDSKGRAVAGLEQKDFRILADNKEREITGFSVETRASSSSPTPAKPGEPATSAAAASPANPRFLSLFFDDFSTATGDLARTKIAAKRFVQDGLGPADRAAIFATSAGMLTSFITDKPQLLAAIDRIQPHPHFSEAGETACPRITPYDAYLIANHMGGLILKAKVDELKSCATAPPQDSPYIGKGPPPAQFDGATLLVEGQAERTWGQVKIVSQMTLDGITAAIDALARANGPRILLIASSGFLTGPLLEPIQNRIIDRSLRAGVVINALDAKGVFSEAPGRFFGELPISKFAPPQVLLWESVNAVAAKEVPTDVLSELAAGTGGLFFHHDNDLSFGFRELGAVPETTYMLAFKPENADDGKFHHLRVRLAKSHPYTLQSRPGYVAIAQPVTEDVARTELDRRMATFEIAQAFPASVRMDFGSKTANGHTPVKLDAHVEIAGLKFPERDGRRVQRLTFVAALIDSHGNTLAAREGSLDFALTAERLESLTKSGVNLGLTLEVPPGDYRLRAVIAEAVETKLTALAYAVKVP